MTVPRFTAWCIGVFLSLTAIAAAAVIAIKGAPMLPTQALFAEQARDTEPQSEPMPSPKLPAYAAIVYKGETLAVLEDTNSANSALETALEIIADRSAKAAGGEAMNAAFIVSPIVRSAQEGVEPVSVEEAATLMAEESSPLKVTVVVRTYELYRAAFETVSVKDDEMMLGTRIIRSYGRDGLIKTELRQLIRDGEAHEKAEISKTVVRESVNREMILGREAVAGRGEMPGRGEGEQGRLPEGLRFVPPAAPRIKVNFGGTDKGYHYGVDYDTDEGDTVIAAEKGMVSSVMAREGYGLLVEIDHGQGFVSRCAQLRDVTVVVGQQVELGENIGTTGTERLHFEIRVDGLAFNPRYYLN